MAHLCHKQAHIGDIIALFEGWLVSARFPHLFPNLNKNLNAPWAGDSAKYQAAVPVRLLVSFPERFQGKALHVSAEFFQVLLVQRLKLSRIGSPSHRGRI